jgi:hypothetical protein
MAVRAASRNECKFFEFFSPRGTRRLVGSDFPPARRIFPQKVCERERRRSSALVPIVIRVMVAPLPVISLVSFFLAVVLTILPAVFDQITAVGAIFAVVPVVVVTVVPIEDADLYAGFLSFGVGHNRGWRNDRGGQDQCADESMYPSHAETLPFRNAQIRTPGRHDYAPPSERRMFNTARI